MANSTDNQRLFVGNLPDSCQEEEIRNEFSAYGTVKSVDLKTKLDPATTKVVNTFAFVVININGRSLQKCLQEFKDEQYRGRYLNVTVARENFLDKLKREREEQAQAAQNNNNPFKSESDVRNTKPTESNLPQLSTKSISSDSESESSDESDDQSKPSTNFDEEDLILKKKSRTFLQNGKIKIPSVSSGGAIHVIERDRKVEKKEFNEKAKQADDRRKESLENMKNSYNQQKAAIKRALAKVDINKSNKISFDDDDQQTGQKMTKRKSLFNEEDETAEPANYDHDFRVKEQFLGKAGAKLMRLQSRFKNDKRFEMDKSFLDESIEAREHQNETVPVTEDSDERKWQYEVLKSVTGIDYQTELNREKKKPQTMLRYDPTRLDHSKYLTVPKRSKDESMTEDSPPADNDSEVEVSKEQFYTVNNNLTTALQHSDGGFSLLKMFGRSDVEIEIKPTTKAILKKCEQPDVNPFKYDSSDSDDEIPQTVKPPVKSKDKDESNESKKKNSEKKILKHENFFLFGSDERFKEGLSFYVAPGRPEANSEIQMDETRKELKKIIKKKIRKSVKNVLPRGVKVSKYKRYKKITKNL